MISSAIKYSVFGAFLFFFHDMALGNLIPILPHNELLKIHIINFLLSFLSSLGFLFGIKLMEKNIGFIFIALNSLKMMASIVYLAWFISNNKMPKNFAIQFVCIFILYLIYEVFFAKNKIYAVSKSSQGNPLYKTK